MRNQTIFKKLILASAIASVTAGVNAAQLEEVIVTAQKRAQSLQDVPISLDVISADDLSDRGISSVDGLAQSLPSLLFQKGNGPAGNNFIIRGIGSQGLEGGIQPSISMTVDGVALGRLGEFSSEMGDIERIEVLRGPQGTLYGRNATAGVINVIRAGASHEFEAYVEQTITDDEEYTTRVMVNGSLSENVAGRLSGFYTNQEDYIENAFAGGPDLGGAENYGVLGRLAIDVSDTLQVKIDADYRELDTREGSQSLTKVMGDAGDTPRTAAELVIANNRALALGNGDLALSQAIRNDPFKTGTDFETRNAVENYGVSMTVDWDMSDSVGLKSISAYRYNGNLGRPDIDLTPATFAAGGNPFGTGLLTVGSTNLSRNPVGGGFTTENEFEYFSQEFRLEGSTDSLEWLAGVYYNHNEETAISEVPTGVQSGDVLFISDRNVGVEFDSYSVFGDVTYSISDSLRVFAGLRWTMEDLDSVVDNRDALISIPEVGLTTAGPGGVVRGADFQTVNAGLIDGTVTFLPAAILEQIFLSIGQSPAQAAGTAGFLGGAPYSAVVAQPAPVTFTASDRSEDWSGRIGASFDFSDDLQVYGSASRGFVGAGANIGRTASAADPILDPSVSTAIEFGIKSDLFDGSVRFNGSIFSQEVKDLQTTRVISGTTNTVSFNAGTLDVMGAEASLTWAASDLLTLDASVSFLDTELSDLTQPCYPGQTAATGCDVPNGVDAGGNALFIQDLAGQSTSNAPDLAYNLNARLDLPFDDLPFDVYTAVAYSWQDDNQFNLNQDPLTVQESYGLIDLTIALEDRDGDWKVTIYGKNLGDETFYSAMSGSQGLNSQGRLMTRIERGSQTYWGIKGRINF